MLHSSAAPGYARRVTGSANGIDQLPDHEFAQLDAHNTLAVNIADGKRISTACQHTGTRRMSARTYSVSVNPNAPLNGLDIDEQLEMLCEETEALLSHFAADVIIEKIAGIGSHIHRNMKVATLRVSSLIGNDGIIDGYVRNAATRTALLVTLIGS